MKTDTKLEKYIRDHSVGEAEVFRELYRQTHLHALHPRMASGHIQGRFLSMLSRLKAPKRILEIGTYTGYSALCLAEGLQDDGLLTSIEINDELEDFIRRYIRQAGMQEKINLIIGDAKTIIPGLEDTYDMVFIDGDKRDYPEYFRICKDKICPDGLLIADNVLWDGKVTETPDARDGMTKGIQEFNTLITEDADFENFILPVRDGLMMATYKPRS
ncbi:MAG: O-methyltransferase [Bacteroidales bacterium]